MVGAVKRPILHQRTKFRKDRSNRCGDIAIFVIFKMAAAAILDFQKFEILTVGPLYVLVHTYCPCPVIFIFLSVIDFVLPSW